MTKENWKFEILIHMRGSRWPSHWHQVKVRRQLVSVQQLTAGSDKVRHQLDTSNKDVRRWMFTSSKFYVLLQGGGIRPSRQMLEPGKNSRSVSALPFPPYLVDTIILISILSFFLSATTCYLVVDKPLSSLTESSVHPFFYHGRSQQNRKISLVLQHYRVRG